jgi:hypothetical protein
MSTPRVHLAVAAAVAGLVLSGCGREAPEVDEIGVVTSDEAVSHELEIGPVQLSYPRDGVYDVGEDAQLHLRVTNRGDADDDLVDVQGPDFIAGLLAVDGRPGAIPVPAGDTVDIDADGPATVVLRDVRRSLRPPESIPVTLVFEQAGHLTVVVVVAAEGLEPAGEPPG